MLHTIYASTHIYGEHTAELLSSIHPRVRKVKSEGESYTFLISSRCSEHAYLLSIQI